jgi:hypothetical protein
MRMRFFIFFEALKFNFVVLTKDVNKRDVLALIASPVRLARVKRYPFLTRFFRDKKDTSG